MLYLASSSSSRAKLLKENGFDFKQIFCDYDESQVSKTLKASVYVQKIVLEKERQFFEKNIIKEHCINTKLDTILFADSVVCIENQIFTKAKDQNEAKLMLDLQSGKHASIISAFLLKSPQKCLFSLSKTTLFFKEFDKKHLENYIQNKLYENKAGSIMCEGFHKDYIVKRVGNLNTALGLDIDTLKAYL